MNRAQNTVKICERFVHSMIIMIFIKHGWHIFWEKYSKGVQMYVGFFSDADWLILLIFADKFSWFSLIFFWFCWSSLILLWFFLIFANFCWFCWLILLILPSFARVWLILLIFTNFFWFCWFSLILLIFFGCWLADFADFFGWQKSRQKSRPNTCSRESVKAWETGPG